MKLANRVFALFFFVVVGLWVVWQPIKVNIEGIIPIPVPWYYVYLIYVTMMIGYPIILIGLAYEIYNPSLILELDRNWKWISIGTFLLIIAAIIITVQVIWIPFVSGYSLLELREFEFPRESGQLYAWPNYLWEFLNSFCMETTSFNLLFGILFMTKSTPQRSKSYKMMLIGAILFEILVPMPAYLQLFLLGFGGGPYQGMTRMQLLTAYWFHWDFWSELAILLSAVYLLKRGKKRYLLP